MAFSSSAVISELQQDPDPVMLDSKALDEYAGSYEGRDGHEIQFCAQRQRTRRIAHRGAETPQKAHARDIFFTPGHGATPKVFQRADNGKIIGFIYLCGKNSIVFRHVVECSILTCFPGRVRHFGAPSRRGRFPSRSG